MSGNALRRWMGLLTFEHMHNLPAEILELFENSSAGFVGSRALGFKERGIFLVGRTFMGVKDGMLCACSSLLASIENGFL